MVPLTGVGAGLQAAPKMLGVHELALYTSTYGMAKCPRARIRQECSPRGVYMSVYEKMDRVTVAEAAARLGVKEQAIRKRIQRATLVHDKGEDGRVYVYLDPEEGVSGTDADAGTNTLLQSLQDQIAYLRQEAEDWKEEARRKDTIIISLTRRIPEIEAPSEAPESPVAPSEDELRGVATAQQAPPEPQEPTQRRSWLYRFFFGPQ